MKRVLLIAIAGLSVGSLAACSSNKARNEANEAAEAMAADTNVTMGEAVNDVDAASTQAFARAENRIDAANAADASDNVIED